MFDCIAMGLGLLLNIKRKEIKLSGKLSVHDPMTFLSLVEFA